jgi:peroxiredoxin
VSQSPTGNSSETGTEELRDYLSAWLAIGEMSRQGDSWSGRERNNIFLNTGDGGFADISALSGADLPHDGRAAALSDWDGDGDLDVWLASRTGPRVRLLRNRSGSGDDFVALRLRGTDSNRDGIGARVRLLLASSTASESSSRIQSLRAGEGFLAQSSKWVHFGLAEGEIPSKIEVLWPAGGLEVFDGIQPGGRYLLTQGGKARRLPARADRLALTASEPIPPDVGGGSHIRLTARPLMPPLQYEDFNGRVQQVPSGKPVLLNLWASWCAPCVGELRDLDRHQAELDAAGLSVLALSVDEDLSRAQDLLENLQLDLPVGVAPAPTLDQLDVLQKALLEERRRLALPMSFLIDADGRLAVLYKGAIELDDLRSDLGILDLDSFETRAATARFPGRWATVPVAFPHQKLAGEFSSFGHPDVARFYERVASGSAGQLAETDATGRKLAAAIELLKQGREGEASKLLESVFEELATRLKANPDDNVARHQLGLLLLAVGRPGAALQAFEQILEREPENVKALSSAALLHWRAGHHQEARELVERVARLDPEAATRVRALLVSN